MKENLSQEIFRAYDIRGVAGKTLTQDTVYRIGRALAYYLNDREDGPIVIVGHDNRISSPQFNEIFQEALIDGGCRVVDIGMVPTPLLYFAVHTLEQSNHGVIITASHNPKEYNGFKIVVDKQALSIDEIQKLYQIARSQNFVRKYDDESKVKFFAQRVTKIDVAVTYRHMLVRDFKLKHPLKVVVDCANAVAGKVVPLLLHQMGCEVETLYCELDGNFPNHSPDPSDADNLKSLIKCVKLSHADLGVAYDGDADRVFFIDENGSPVSSDYMIMLFAKYILTDSKKGKIIYDVKCSAKIKSVAEA